MEASLAWDLSRGLPLAKALPLAFPQDPWARGFEEEFLVGTDLLVAPLVEPGGKREVYLPEGRWYDLWTGGLYEGPTLVRKKWPLEQIPLFAREGAVIPLGSPSPSLRAEDVVLQGVVLVGKGGERNVDQGQVLGVVSEGFTLGRILFGEGL
ncbi:hypothetical protein [Thermus scotoductus]|uniref:hypothetical protein n=1 Tax=Thermus scotoductus TaxID=37636 RepID=UPI00339D9712